MAGQSGSYADESDGGIISDINVTPLVDIVLVLLIVFMITVPSIVNNPSIKVELPKAQSGDETQKSTVSLTLTYDPTKLRVRSVQQGSFMRTGGIDPVFSSQTNTPGRIDITLSRAGDATGASGTGLLAAVLFDAIAPGTATLTTSGAATGPGGTAMGLQFQPIMVIVQ